MLGIDLAARAKATPAVRVAPGAATWRATTGGPLDGDASVDAVRTVDVVGVEPPLRWPGAFVDAIQAVVRRTGIGEASPPGRLSTTMVSVDDVRGFATALPRTTEALVRDRVKFRVGRIVYVAFSRDETLMGFAFPKEERDALVGGDPDRFLMPCAGDLRYRWVVVRLATIDLEEMRELVLDAWRMCVPKSVAARYGDSNDWRGQ